MEFMRGTLADSMRPGPIRPGDFRELLHPPEGTATAGTARFNEARADSPGRWRNLDAWGYSTFLGVLG